MTNAAKGTILVTGASRGIGAAVARLVAEAGHPVAINYLANEAAAAALAASIADAGGRAALVRGDVAVQADAERIVREAEEALGPLAGLVNNAGITGRLGRFLDADPASIERVFAVNVLGTMHCCRAALAGFQRHGTAGVIVNLSSVAAATGSPHEYVHYAASKAAVETFTYGLAREVAGDGIRVCCVAPGSTLTDIHAAAGDAGRPARIAPRIPLGRLATPDEIAQAVLWLLSPAASYVTGATLRCAGGL